MLKESSQNPELKNFERLELMALVSLENSIFLKEKEELSKLQVTYLQAIDVVHDIYQIGKCGQSLTLLNDTPVKAMVESIFKNQSGTIEWIQFIQALRTNMKGAGHFIKSYFSNKFMLQDIKPQIPQLTSPSYILNSETLFQLLTSAFHTQLNGSHQLSLIYSNIVHPGGFPIMVQSLLQSNLPTIMLFQHEEFFTQLHDRSILSKPYIFGAISNQRWFNTGLSCGLKQDCIFSLFPEFRIYNSKREQFAQKNYCYLNFEKIPDQPEGIGFGGSQDGHNCRIWIDKNFETESYAKVEDSSYESGHLVGSHIKKLNINLIEIWGISHPASEEDPITEVEVKPAVTNSQINRKSNLNLQSFGGQDTQTQNQLSGGNYYWTTEKQADFYWMKEEQSDDEEEDKVLENSQPGDLTDRQQSAIEHAVFSTETVFDVQYLDGQFTSPVESDRIKASNQNTKFARKNSQQSEASKRYSSFRRKSSNNRDTMKDASAISEIPPSLKQQTEIKSGNKNRQISQNNDLDISQSFEQLRTQTAGLNKAQTSDQDQLSRSGHSRRRIDPDIISRYSVNSGANQKSTTSLAKPASFAQKDKPDEIQQYIQSPSQKNQPTDQAKEKEFSFKKSSKDILKKHENLTSNSKSVQDSGFTLRNGGQTLQNSKASRASQGKTVEDVMRNYELRQSQGRKSQI